MKLYAAILYTLILALWTGGIAILTFVVTPAIFRSYGRDMAGEIVGKLFPGYFTYNLALSALALVVLFLLGADRSTKAFQLSLALLAVALLANAYVSFKLHPDTVHIKQQVASFEREPSDSPARKEFRRLHGISAVVNLLILADGVALLVISRNLVKGG